MITRARWVRIARSNRIFISLILAGGTLVGCGTTFAEDKKPGEVDSRGMPQVQQPTQPSQTGQPILRREPVKLPTFPQKFEVQGPETQSFGFAVTQPGPIVVDVQEQGALVIVTLQSPGGQPITQQAAGNLRLSYTVTPQDVQRSLFWTLQIRLAQPRPPQQGGHATGSVNVQYPPVNETVVQQAVQAAATQRRPPTAQERAQAAAQAKARMDAAFQAYKAQFELQRQQRHSALMAAVQPLLAQMQAQTEGAVRSRGVGETPASEMAQEPNEEVTSRALLAPSPAMVNPTITALSVSQGQPGDPVMINGSGFGSNGGEIHFVLANGKDVVAPVGAIWTGTQIFTSVPDATGLLAFNGQVYIKRADQKMSNLTSFRFEPALEMREIQGTWDRVLAQPYNEGYTTDSQISRYNDNWFAGFYGNDQFFVNTRLLNTWVEQNVFVTAGGIWECCQDGGVYVWDSRIGTDWPYLNARWWINTKPMYLTGAAFDYTFSVRIIGPKGVPDGVVCTQIPCPPSQ